MSLRKEFPEIAKCASSEATERLSRMYKNGFKIHGADGFGDFPVAWLLNFQSGMSFVAGIDEKLSDFEPYNDAELHKAAIAGVAELSNRHPQAEMSAKARNELGMACWTYIRGTSTFKHMLEARKEGKLTKSMDFIILVSKARKGFGSDIRPSAGFGTIPRDPTSSGKFLLGFANILLEQDRLNQTGWFNPNR